MAAHHPLATKPRLTLKEIAAHPIAIPPANYAVRQLLESAARREAVHFDMRFITSSMEVQKTLALQGRTLLILPQLHHQEPDAQAMFVAVPLADPLMGKVKVDLCLPRQRTLSMATRLFHDMLSQRIDGQNALVNTTA
jgi:DNA-binding transcriptional LysR family regulator